MCASHASPNGSHVHIPPASARPFLARAGDYVTVVDLEGQQIGDFVAFNAADHKERFSTCHTRSVLRRLYLREGDQLYTTRRRPMLEIVEDPVGSHDILIAPCDSTFYEQRYGLIGHPNCLDNLAAALAEHGIARWDVPEPLNVFQNTRVDADGSFVPSKASSRPGDRIVLRALMDIAGAVSACAQDQGGVNGERLTPLLVMISRASRS